jgi:hypothetical protein
VNRTQLNKLNHAYSRADVSGDAEAIDRVREARPQFLIARIESYTSIGTNRWLYNWSMAEVQPTTVGTGNAFAVRPAETWYTGQALNVCEGFNSAGYVGPGINPANIPAGFSVQPITGYVMIFPQNRAIVSGAGGEKMWVFYAPNAIDGQCTTPLDAGDDFGTFFFPTNDFEAGTFDAEEGDRDFGAINPYDYATFAFPLNDLNFQTFASPYLPSNDMGTF